MDVLDELPGREVPGHGEAAERVTDDEIGRIVRAAADADPRVADAHAQSFDVWSPRRSRPIFSTVGSISNTVLSVPGYSAARYRGIVKPPPPMCSASNAWASGHATATASLNDLT